MAGYLLNLTFKQPTSAATADGLFNSNTADPTSKIWYQVPSIWPGQTYAPGAKVSQPVNLASWPQQPPFPIVDKCTPPFSCNLGDDIYMRVVPDSSWPSLANLNVGFGAAFGRPATTNHSDATLPAPFVLPAGNGIGINSPCAFFQWSPGPPTASDNSCWIFYLGQPLQNKKGQRVNNEPAKPDRVCGYTFIVSAYVSFGNGSVYTFGHDPGMDVTG